MTIQMDASKQGKKLFQGIVTESLPDTHFRVKLLDEDKEIMTYLGGKMKINRIRIFIGDKVTVEIDQYGGKGRIVRRM